MLRSRPWTSHTPERIRLAGGKERAVPKEMTLREFMAFPWPEGQRWELIGGTPVMTPSPLFWHQDLQGELFTFLRKRLEGRPSLRAVQCVDIRLDEADDHVCPDLAVIELKEAGNLSKLPIRTVPALIVEILSPSTSGNDLGAKLEAYAEAGVAEYWVVNPGTGSLLIYVNPAEGEYSEQRADEDGFVPSPLAGTALKIRLVKDRYKIETR